MADKVERSGSDQQEQQILDDLTVLSGDGGRSPVRAAVEQADLGNVETENLADLSNIHFGSTTADSTMARTTAEGSLFNEGTPPQFGEDSVVSAGGGQQTAAGDAPRSPVGAGVAAEGGHGAGNAPILNVEHDPLLTADDAVPQAASPAVVETPTGSVAADEALPIAGTDQVPPDDAEAQVVEDDAATSTVARDVAAEAPELDVQGASGAEDTAIALDIDAVLTDLDGSESLSVTISGIPEGASLSAGTDNGDGSWTLTPNQLEGLTITPPADSSADFDLTITATSRESASGDETSVTRTLTVDVAAVADAAELTVADAAGSEDGAIALDIGASVSGTEGVAS
ncbi:MAG: hypothetical protein H7841_10370, partial [Magnetospirillum sp. WYHS-4]